ncbi:response regulator [Salegentibacter sp. F188]|uniref:Response regulator n=1 Tax=Autumnicola patrickiae TaxID=3075591 RepID=A0ABU3E646_9FLAO|nr:response regulator [Salegentibacter sp. F188]MDT0690687.1 response regulator [Salegentibacter sp. F188]
MKKIDLACIIDDDPIFVFGAKKIMQFADFCNSFMVYHNGEEAIKGLKSIILAKEKLPDIILLDLNMPIMDGWQFLDEFTQIPTENEITIYIVTSSIDPEDVNRAKTYNRITNYLVKPISIEDLRKALQEG